MFYLYLIGAVGFKDVANALNIDKENEYLLDQALRMYTHEYTRSHDELIDKLETQYEEYVNKMRMENCYVCGNKAMAKCGHYYNINSNACSVYVCDKCDYKIEYSEEKDVYILSKGATNA